ncbi:lysophospholipid acyltransferase family protein [Chloroflexota bacterium]
MPWFYYVGGFLIRIAFFFLTQRRVTGQENVPAQGSLLIVSNHLNLTDPALLDSSIGRKMVFMAKEELFRSRFSGYFIRSYGAFPVNRERLRKGTLKEAERWLAKGIALVIFPEGQRSQNARLQPAFAGPTLIASRTGAPILPVGISGTENIKGATWWLRRPSITVNIGQPFNLPPASGKLTRADLAQLTNSIMEHIAELLPPQYRGNYAGVTSKYED